MPPVRLQWRTEHRVELLNEQTYGAAWAWLPTPLWLTLVDPEADGAELARLVQQWNMRGRTASTAAKTAPHTSAHLASAGKRLRRSLPVIAR
jgi:hypothetical protein